MIVRLFIICFFIVNYAYGQYNIEHKNLSIVFNHKKHIPELVHWVLKRNSINCVSKNNRIDFSFKNDTKFDNYTNYELDYYKSGYDKGHLKPYNDAHCDNIESNECFYYTNIAPQNHQLNIGVWKTLENRCRKLSKNSNIEIYAGCFDSLGMIKNIIIPKYFYKCVINNKDTVIYVFKNVKPSTNNLNKYIITKHELYQMFNKLKPIIN